jgi:hypothetical protein
MEAGQVVQVRALERDVDRGVVTDRVAAFGSGYLIAPRLVLTAAHLVPASPLPGQVTVAHPEADDRFPAVVRWRRLDDTVDAALLEIPADVADWQPPVTLRGARGRRPQRWGRFVTSGTEVEVVATGFPRQQREVRAAGHGGEPGGVVRRREELRCRVRPHGGGGTFEILDTAGLTTYDTTGLDPERARSTTQLSGMSGAAVFLEGEKLLLGIVREDRRPQQGTRLVCTRSEDLLACEDFRAAVRAATSADPQLEAAELAALLEPAPPRRELTSPSMLLRADAEVVSFHGRQDVLADLEQWCLADPDGAPAARVVTAPGGQGKSRLARQLMARMRERGWVAGQVLRRPEGLRALRTVQHPLLLVVDYAETRPELVRELREQTRACAHPVRLLLLARSLGSWQNRASGPLPETRLHALSPGAADGEQAYRLAVRDFSRRLAEVTGQAATDWAALADTAPSLRPGATAARRTAGAVNPACGGERSTPPSGGERTALPNGGERTALPSGGERTAQPSGGERTALPNGGERTAPSYGGGRTALAVQMAALAGLLRHVRAPDRDGQTFEAQLLAHERTYWQDTADARGLAARDTELVDQAVAAAVLCPAQDEDEAIETVARLRPAEPERLAAWLRDLYPPPEGRYWGRIEPDRLAESHACEQVLAEPGLLARLLARAPDHQRVQTLTVLARAAVAHADEHRADTARELVARLRAALRAVPAEAPLTAAVLRAHSDALPRQTHVLREYALDVARELDRLCRASGDGPRAVRERAWALHNLAERQLAVGAWEDARTAAEGAAAIRERLAEEGAYGVDGAEEAVEEGGAFGAVGKRDREGETERRTEWAESLLALSFASRMSGRLADAHRAGERALTLFRELAAVEGEEQAKRERGLVRALLNLSQVLWRLDPDRVSFDQIAESDAHTDEAVRRARELAAAHPELDPALLAEALTERSTSLWRLSRHEESMELSETAVETSRRLATENPDGCTADLAQALRGLAVDYADAERPEGASRALEEEAIALLRPLAEELPAVHRPGLAQLLHNRACGQFGAGDGQKALRTMEEAVGLRRALVDEGLQIALPGLAHSLGQLATFHARAGDHGAAVAGFEECLRVYASSRLPLSAGDLHTRSQFLLKLAFSLDSLGRTADALARVDEALADQSRLSAFAPALYTESHALSLHDGADLYRRYNRQLPRRILLRRALPLYRRRARESEAGRRGLAFCLQDLGTSYGASWTNAERAVPVLLEAYELWTRLAAEDARDEVHLADTCAELCLALLSTGRYPKAARVSAHEVRLRRRLLGPSGNGEEPPPDEGDPSPDGGGERYLCYALLRLAEARAMAGQQEAAWRVAREAERVCEALAARPGGTPEQTAWLLYRLGGTLGLAGRHDVRLAARGIAPARRAVRLYQELVDRDPSRQPELRRAAAGLARILERTGRHAVATEVRHRRGA